MASQVRIQCPHCGQRLKGIDPQLNGKRVKCPGCRQPFVLRLPEASDGRVASPTLQDLPLGLNARWSGASESTAGERPAAQGPPTTSEFDFVKPAAPVPQIQTPLESHFYRGRPAKSRSSRQRTIAALSCAGGVLLVAVLAFVFWPTGDETTAQRTSAAQAGPANASNGAASAAHPGPYGRDELATNPELLNAFAPTQGEPVPLRLLPAGVNLVIHFRPALLYSSELRGVRTSLTTAVTDWLSEQLTSLSGRDPEQIEEATIAYIFGAIGTAPLRCVVFRFEEPTAPTQWRNEIESQGGHPGESTGSNLLFRGENAYLVADEKTLVVCSAELAPEIAESQDRPQPELSSGMAQLLELSDRQRLLTIVGNTDDLKRQAADLVPETLREPLQASMDWFFGTEMETISWSLHTQPYLHSRLDVRPTSVVEARRLQAILQQRLEQLPKQLWKEVCLKMHPREVRFREFIGRLPAMVEAWRQSTVATHDEWHVRLTTVLPEKAVPNLLLATLFTVNEAARTNFTNAASATAGLQPEREQTFEDALSTPIDADFNRMAIEAVLEFLASESQLKIEIDQPAFQDAGFTRNMPQNIALGRVPLRDVLAAIVNRYQEPNRQMAVVVDATAKTVTFTTQKFATQRNQQIFLP